MYYNLIVVGSEGYWDEGENSFYRGRFLEYTTDETIEDLNLKSPDGIHELINYPTVLAYENGDAFFASLNDIKIEKSNLSIEFTIDENAKIVKLDELIGNKNLKISDFECSRTHWAVKKTNNIDNLYSFFEVQKEKAGEITRFNPSEAAVYEDNTYKDVADVINKVISFSAENTDNNNYEMYCRGHSDESYNLLPSIFRKNSDGSLKYPNNEHILYQEILVTNSNEFNSDVCTFDKLVRMQHYSLPTRLLDISSNPLIALYFACLENKDKHGSLTIFKISKSSIKYFDSDTVSILSNLSRLPANEKEVIFNLSGKGKSIDEFNANGAVQMLHHFIRNEKPFFRPKIKEEELKKIVCVKAKKNNERIISQSGAFLIFGQDHLLLEDTTENITFEKIIIDKNSKEKILMELNALNINESTVAPYIENSAKYLSKKYSYIPD